MNKPAAAICMVKGCDEWGCWGYHFGRVTLCGEHRKIFERDEAALELELQAERAAAEPPAQGRLL